MVWRKSWMACGMRLESHATRMAIKHPSINSLHASHGPDVLLLTLGLVRVAPVAAWSLGRETRAMTCYGRSETDESIAFWDRELVFWRECAREERAKPVDRYDHHAHERALDQARFAAQHLQALRMGGAR